MVGVEGGGGGGGEVHAHIMCRFFSCYVQFFMSVFAELYSSLHICATIHGSTDNDSSYLTSSISTSIPDWVLKTYHPTAVQ